MSKITWSDQHKFVCGGEGYRTVVFCEYCGTLAFYGNVDMSGVQQLQATAREPCPRTPAAVNQPVTGES